MGSETELVCTGALMVVSAVPLLVFRAPSILWPRDRRMPFGGGETSSITNLPTNKNQ